MAAPWAAMMVDRTESLLAGHSERCLAAPLVSSLAELTAASTVALKDDQLEGWWAGLTVE